jgi:hypothetical protein
MNGFAAPQQTQTGFEMTAQNNAVENAHEIMMRKLLEGKCVRSVIRARGPQSKYTYTGNSTTNSN